jgi:hypothetical protein
VTTETYPAAQISLMKNVRIKWGALIDATANPTGISAPFLAALIANESGGELQAQRFEKEVLASLFELAVGDRDHYGSIATLDLLNYVELAIRKPDGPEFEDGCKMLKKLATSWGLTQVMGYEAIPARRPLATISSAVGGLGYTANMLHDFARRFALDPLKDFSELFNCWNTGRAHAATADPQYAPNGMLRMAIYRDLLEEPPRAVSA